MTSNPQIRECYLVITHDLLSIGGSLRTRRDVMNDCLYMTPETWAARNPGREQLDVAVALGDVYYLVIDLTVRLDSGHFMFIDALGVEHSQEGDEGIVWEVGDLSIAAGVYGTEIELRALNPQLTSSAVPPGAFTCIVPSDLDKPYFEDVGGSSYYLLFGGLEPYLRMSQRNDGRGIARHPRIRVSSDASTSVQTGASPRVGRTNRYR